MKIAVFGHYDSRGGTTAIPLPDQPTRNDVWESIRRYDLELFGYTKEDTFDYGSPGIEDFLYVAELHGDLTDRPDDLDSEYGSVLIDNNTVPGGDDEPASTKIDFIIQSTIENPVQLEFTRAVKRHDFPQIPDDHPLAERAREVGLDPNRQWWSSSFTPEQNEVNNQLCELRRSWELDAEREVAATAKHLTDPSYRNWDDDAYGFILM